MLKRFLLIGVGFILALGFLELGLQIYYAGLIDGGRNMIDSRLGLVPRPNATGRVTVPGVYDYTFTHDGEGYRSSGNPPSQVNHRILFLGDSFTYGLGVNDDETFSSVAQRRLAYPPTSARVYNAGIPGIGTDYELRFFQIRGIPLHPNLTAVCFFSHDFIRTEAGWYYDIKGGKAYPHGISKPLIVLHALGIIPYQSYSGNSKLMRWLVQWSYAANLLNKELTHDALESAGRGAEYATSANIEQARVYLTELVKEAKESGSAFVVFYIPRHGDVALYRDEHSFSNDELALEKLCKDASIAFVSLTPVLAGSNIPLDLLYYKEDGHWKKDAHAMAGQFMSDYVSQHLVP